ncbi:hypothetical protein [Fibrella aquatilis]|uniref:Uncharacterized protein n=1 Tax=Fibrella aquatilis TaxID=2817059 RepID=A0A939G3W6_9BACT|nr:hypothetical protein [Fibrella aquatilis]MBO0931887.1 hypothetical protein [Fibrella aquatilis]
MHCFSSPARIRLAIDSRINRDLILTALQAGFDFSNPDDDLPIWHSVAETDLENPAHMCSPDVAIWLMGKAIEVTLFQLYQSYSNPIG